MAPKTTKDASNRSQTRAKAGVAKSVGKHFDDGESSDEDYRKKRDKNNQAVKKSRVKSRLRTQETQERVQKLKTENDMLEEKIKILSKELRFLKDLFLAHAGSSHSIKIEGIDLEALLSDANSMIDSDHNDL